MTKEGVSAIFQTTGNETCHVILRGGTQTGPNFDADHVSKVCAQLAAEGAAADGDDRLLARQQPEGSRQGRSMWPPRLCEQVASGSWQVFGAMLESHLVEGRQDYLPGQPAVYGQSITDACISLAKTDPLLEQFATAQQTRGSASGRSRNEQ